MLRPTGRSLISGRGAKRMREKIIQEALRLFSMKGFLSTSISDILEAARISKGGLYNHFKSKEELFYEVMSKSRKMWREKNLEGLDLLEKPVDKIIKLLENYRDRYLRDSENFPGGCIFVTVSVELHGQELPHLVRELDKGFDGLKAMLAGFLNEAGQAGHLKDGVNAGLEAEMIFCGMIGAAVLYGMDKSSANLQRTIGALINHLKSISA